MIIKEEDLIKYKRIYLCKDPDFFHIMCRKIEEKQRENTDAVKPGLVLTSASQENIVSLKGLEILYISEEEEQELKRLYFTYEFTDNFIYISDSSKQYGTIFDFMETGILTKEEALEALLW